MQDFFEKRVIKPQLRDFYLSHRLPLTAEQLTQQAQFERSNPNHPSHDEKQRALDILLAARAIASYFREEDYRLPPLSSILRNYITDNKYLLKDGWIFSTNVKDHTVHWAKPKDSTLTRVSTVANKMLDLLRRDIFGNPGLQTRQNFLVDKLKSPVIKKFTRKDGPSISFSKV